MANYVDPRNNRRSTGDRLAAGGRKRLLEEADQRGHGNRSQGAAVGGGFGALVGSFLGIGGAMVGAAVGAAIGGAIGESMD